jgi:hypothetical protein
MPDRFLSKFDARPKSFPKSASLTMRLAGSRYASMSKGPTSGSSQQLQSIRQSLRQAAETTASLQPEDALPEIQRLRQSLDFSRSPEIALGLRQLYDYCTSQIQAQNPAEARRVLLEMEKLFAVSKA